MKIPAEVLALGKAQADSFETDPDAPEGSYAWHYHRTKQSWDAYRAGGIADPAKSRYKLERASDLLKRKVARLVWLVFGILPAICVAVIAGRPKSSKSWLLLELALSVANRAFAFGEFKAGEHARKLVVLFMAEDTALSMQTRLRSLAVGRGLDPVAATQNIYIQTHQQIDITVDADLCGFVATMKTLGEDPAMVGFDPFRNVHAAEENDSGQMANVMTRLRFIRDEFQCAVPVVHHLGKESKDTAGRSPGEQMRGSTAVDGARDVGIFMTLKDKSESHWDNAVTVDVKAARGAGTFGLRLDVQDDENAEATCAKWTFSREVGNKAKADAAALRKTILASVTEAPASAARLAGEIGKRDATILQTLRAMKAEGLVAQIDGKWQPSSASSQRFPEEPLPHFPTLKGGKREKRGRQSKHDGKRSTPSNQPTDPESDIEWGGP